MATTNDIIKMDESDRREKREERIATALERIATAQEQMVAVAMEAREERMKLSAQMKERLKAGFSQEK